MSAFVNVPDFPFASETALHRAGERLAGRRSFVLYLTNKLRRQPDSGRAHREHEIPHRLVPRVDNHYGVLTRASRRNGRRSTRCCFPSPP